MKQTYDSDNISSSFQYLRVALISDTPPPHPWNAMLFLWLLYWPGEGGGPGVVSAALLGLPYCDNSQATGQGGNGIPTSKNVNPNCTFGDEGNDNQ